MRVLVTGATGTIGRALLSALEPEACEVVAGVRDVEAARATLGAAQRLTTVDFTRALYPSGGFDAVFLLRPPQLANPDPFEAFLKQLTPRPKVVFLSVLGADRQPYLPHAKIEKRIEALGLEHVFIRPSYFMENLITALLPELKARQRIFLPAGSLRLNWIASADVAAVSAKALVSALPVNHVNVASDVTHSFEEVAETLRRYCGAAFHYPSPTLLEYLHYSALQKQTLSYTAIMLLLHYLPRLTGAPSADASDVRALLGRAPQSLDAFIESHCEVFR